MSSPTLQGLIRDGVCVMHHDYRSRSFSDLSKNGNDGVATDVVWGNTGVFFNETTSEVAVADTADTRLTEGALIVFGDFIQPDGAGYLISKEGGGGVNYTFYVTSTTINLYDGATTSTLTTSVSGKKMLAVNFKDGVAAEFFLDNVSAGSGVLTNSISTANVDVILGNKYTGSENLSERAISFSIMNRNLTSTEYSSLYSELEAMKFPTKTISVGHADMRVNTLDPDIVGGWKMLLDSGIILDQTLLSSDGTVVGYPMTSKTLFGPMLYFDGVNDYIDIGNTGQTIKTVSFWMKPSSTTEDIIDFDGGTHTVEIIAATLTATGFATPSIYINGEANTYARADVFQHVVITSNTGFSASALKYGKETTYFDGWLGNLEIYSETKDATWAAAKYQEGALAQSRTDWGINEWQDNITTGTISNSPFEQVTGSWRVATDSINGSTVKVLKGITGTNACSLPVCVLNQTPEDSGVGKWTYWIYRGVSHVHRLAITDVPAGSIGTNGWVFYANASGIFIIGRVSGGSVTSGKMTTAAGTIPESQWVKITITRDPEGSIAAYLNDVLMTAATGANPTVADNTWTSMNYLYFDVDIDDLICLGDIDGNYAITKQLISK